MDFSILFRKSVEQILRNRNFPKSQLGTAWNCSFCMYPGSHKSIKVISSLLSPLAPSNPSLAARIPPKAWNTPLAYGTYPFLPNSIPTYNPCWVFPKSPGMFLRRKRTWTLKLSREHLSQCTVGFDYLWSMNEADNMEDDGSEMASQWFLAFLRCSLGSRLFASLNPSTTVHISIAISRG